MIGSWWHQSNPRHNPTWSHFRQEIDSRSAFEFETFVFQNQRILKFEFEMFVFQNLLNFETKSYLFAIGNVILLNFGTKKTNE